MKVGDLLAMTAMTLLDDSRNWGHFWKIKSIHGTYQYPTYAILNLCFCRGDQQKIRAILGVKGGHTATFLGHDES
jgi:hypothetical protein